MSFHEVNVSAITLHYITLHYITHIINLLELLSKHEIIEVE